MNLTKPLLTTAIVIIALAVVSYFLHIGALQMLEVQLPYDLLDFYIFGGVSSLIICLTFITLPALLPELQDKVGYMFLFTIFGKLFLWALFFCFSLFFFVFICFLCF